MSPPQQKQERVIFIRCTQEQFERVQTEARRRGLAVASFARSVLLKKIDESDAARSSGKT